MFRIVLISFLLVLAGCGDTGALYRHESAKPPAAKITKPSLWTAQGGVYKPQYAIDSNHTTFSYSDSSYSNAMITIDLGKACLFNSVYIDHGARPGGFAKRLAVLTSLDGRNFVKRHEAPGTKKVTSLCIISPVLARYIKIQAVRGGNQPWAIAEIVIQ